MASDFGEPIGLYSPLQMPSICNFYSDMFAWLRGDGRGKTLVGGA
jgi:hypothetical protein